MGFVIAFIETQSRKRNFNTETIHNMIKFTGESNVPFFLGRDEESVCDNKNLNDFGTTVIQTHFRLSVLSF
jgi:hypothetical protein